MCVRVCVFLGTRPTGDLLEESQSEALKLRKRVEELVRDNEALKSSTSSFASACIGTPVHADAQGKSRRAFQGVRPDGAVWGVYLV